MARLEYDLNNINVYVPNKDYKHNAVYNKNILCTLNGAYGFSSAFDGEHFLAGLPAHGSTNGDISSTLYQSYAASEASGGGTTPASESLNTTLVRSSGSTGSEDSDSTENEHVCLVGKDLEEFRTKQCTMYINKMCANSSRCNMSHSETWPRRNPTVYKYDYKLCPNIQFFRHENKMQLHGKCNYGRRCKYSHSKEEQLYHPELYKTRYCINYPNCKGYYCPFAHSKSELRVVTTNGSPQLNGALREERNSPVREIGGNLGRDRAARPQMRNARPEREAREGLNATHLNYGAGTNGTRPNSLNSTLKNGATQTGAEPAAEADINIRNLSLRENADHKREESSENWFEMVIKSGLNLIEEEERLNEIFNNYQDKGCAVCPKCMDLSHAEHSKYANDLNEADYIVKKYEDLFKLWDE